MTVSTRGEGSAGEPWSHVRTMSAACVRPDASYTLSLQHVGLESSEGAEEGSRGV